MTEKASGAMTAQEFWLIHFSTHDSRLLDKDGSCALADALSARNTAELWAALADAQREIQMANDALGGNPAVHLCDRIFTLRTEADRLRDQGAQPSEKAAEECYEVFNAWLGKVLRMETAMPAYELKPALAELIRKYAPVEGAGQWEAGRDAADSIVSKAWIPRSANQFQDGWNAAISLLSGDIKALQPPAGLASPPEGQK